MRYPEFAKIGDKKYKINTDFKVAVECNRIAEDETIGEYERALAIIYKLFGDEGLNDIENHGKLLELGLKFLSCGKDIDSIESDSKKDMDYTQDMDYIETSFISDYGIDLTKTDMHWWKFFNLLNGLSNSDFGNCCILNRIRNIRNTNLNDIKDAKEREKMMKAKQYFSLDNKVIERTEEEMQSAETLLKDLGFLD